MNGIIVLTGNDGSGKSTLCQLGHPDYIVVERSSSSPYAELAKSIDRLTLLHQFEDAYTNQTLLCATPEGLPIYYVVLDPPVASLTGRLSARLHTDKWETQKSLKYFKKRFQNLAVDFGIPMFDNSSETPEETMTRIVDFIRTRYTVYRQLALLSLTRDQMERNDLENFLQAHLTLPTFEPIRDPYIYLEGMESDSELAAKLYRKQLVNDPSRYQIRDGHLYVDAHPPIPIPKDILLMRTVVEGESKRIYQLVDSNLLDPKYCVIVLKSTIYSHSRQSTGEIGGLANIRAIGTQLMLEMLARNNISHSYLSINREGIIVSEWLDDIVPLEIVVKEYCLGTDKHSYYGLARNEEIVDPDLRYKFGRYVRFDWRNPNHLISMVNPVESPYYYTIEGHYGKEAFFERFLKQTHVRPLGDKQISEDVISQFASTTQLKKLVLRTFMTIQAYLRRIGLEVQDACFMADRSGHVLWSEINQDCMRIVTRGNADLRFDKDIWRAGGSSSKELLLFKWTQFNDIMMAHMNEHRFDPSNYYSYIYESEMLFDSDYGQLYREICQEDYTQLYGTAPNRDLIVTMDLYDGQPVLVRNGIVTEVHSPSVEVALEKIGICPNILLVDLNRAIPGSGPSPNREIIKRVGLSHYIYTGGGVKTSADVEELLSSSIRRVVVGSNHDLDFLRSIPSNRLIVELTVNEHNQVLTHGRTVNTGIVLSEYMMPLLQAGIDTFSVTFHHTEGLLRGIPRLQIAELLLTLPLSRLNKVIIAGGIASMEDLEFLWSLPKVVPQVGSVIWKHAVSIGQIYSGLLKFSHRIPTVIQNKTGLISEVLTIDHASLLSMIDSRIYRDNTIAKIEVNPNHLLVVIDRVDVVSSSQSIVKTNLWGLVEHIKSRSVESSSKFALQQNPERVLAKILNDFHDLLCTADLDLVPKASDVLMHLLMYLNGKGVPFEDIQNQLNAYRWNPGWLQPKMSESDRWKIGITGDKYCFKTDSFIQEQLGVRIIRPSGRSLKISSEIVDPERYSKYFGSRMIEFIACRPKDMIRMMEKNEIAMAITYSTVMDNQPSIWTCLVSVPDPSIKLCLIRRKNERIDYSQMIRVACEHPRNCSQYFRSLGLSNFQLDYLTGKSESFLLTDTTYVLCDAVVESGRTLIENDLEVEAVVLDHGTIQIGLYTL